MALQGHLPRSYQALNTLAERIHARLQRTLPEVPIYSRFALSKRTTQGVVEILLNPFLRELAARVAAGNDLLPPERDVLRCGGFRINQSTGDIHATLPLVIRRVGEFMLLWCYALMVMGSWMLRAPATSRGAATLVYGVGRENIGNPESSARFLKFCRDGPIEPLVKASRLVVQRVDVPAAHRAEDGIEFSRFPLLALLLGQRFQAGWLLRLLRHHFSALLQYFFNVLRAPVLCVLGRDYAEHGLAVALNDHSLIENIIITNSNYARQPLWMTNLPGRRYRLHMVWYSVSGSNPLVYKVDPVVGVFPLAPLLRADEFWYWTPGQAAFYARLGVDGTTHVVGPILWYLPGSAPAASSDGLLREYRVAVFDVTPTNPAFAQGYGLAYNYYDGKNVAAFIEDVITAQRAAESALNAKVAVILKNKRTYAGIHDQDYLSLIRALSRPGGSIRLVPPETDMFSLISNSDLTVVIPFSSPAYVASHLGVSAVYHDTTGMLAPTFEASPKIRFSSSRDELARVFVAELGQPRRNAGRRGNSGVLGSAP